ncbi:ATPase [Bacillus cereus]|nr:ATPase [Bacillus cereus]MDW4537854.1 ATPase [Bacillus cereus]
MNLTHDTLASMGGIVLLVNMFLGGLFGLGSTVKFLTQISLSYLIKTG